MQKLTVATLVVGSLFASACKKDEPKPTPAPAPAKMQGTEPAKADVPAASPIATFAEGNYAIDGGHSAIIWKAKHLGIGYTYGWFKDFSGTINVSKDLTKASVAFEIKVDSIDSRDAKRDDHLRGTDFFSSKEFPTITFKSTKIEAAGTALKVMGDLTLKGQTKPMTLNVTPVGAGVDPWGNTRVGFESKLTVNRGEFGLGFMPEAIGNDIEMMFSFEGMIAKK